jgi:hypothetical protein
VFWKLAKIALHLAVLDPFRHGDGLAGHMVEDDGADDLSTVGGAGDGGAQNGEEIH